MRAITGTKQLDEMVYTKVTGKFDQAMFFLLGGLRAYHHQSVCGFPENSNHVEVFEIFTRNWEPNTVWLKETIEVISLLKKFSVRKWFAVLDRKVLEPIAKSSEWFSSSNGPQRQ